MPESILKAGRRPLLTALLLSFITAACSSTPDAPETVVSSGPKPWNDGIIDNSEEKFTFAIFSDLTGGERPDVFSVAVEQLNLLRPDFIMNVGDLIEGGTRDRAQLGAEWDSFEQRADKAIARVYFTGGNHDLTNTTMWEVWEERYGATYYHFLYQDALFLVMDTEDNTPQRQDQIDALRNQAMARVAEEGWGIYSETDYSRSQEAKTGHISEQQAAYFREVIANHPDVRWTFLFTHKPVWQTPDEKNFLSVEEALDDRPYTVFYGHVHGYKHQMRRGRDYIQMGTTGGVQLTSREMPVDHITLVTLAEDEPVIANIKMSGLFDKTGRIPLNGESLCFDIRDCPAD